MKARWGNTEAIPEGGESVETARAARRETVKIQSDLRVYLKAESPAETTGPGPPWSIVTHVKKAHTFQRTIGANTVEDQVVLAGLPYLPVYTVATSPVAATVANSHVLQIMAGSSLNLYILGIDVWQFSSATTAAWIDWRLFRLTTAGTGGSAYTPQPFNTADAAAGATAMTLPSAKGTETTNLWAGASYFVQTPGAAGFQPLPVFTWKADLSNLIAPIRIAAGTANGLALKCVTGVVANVIVTATFVEASF